MKRPLYALNTNDLFRLDDRVHVFLRVENGKALTRQLAIDTAGWLMIDPPQDDKLQPQTEVELGDLILTWNPRP